LKKTIIILAFCVASGSVGLQRAAAQQAGPPPAPEPASASLVARNPLVTSSRAVAPRSPANPAGQQSIQTKVVRIYGGAGYFDVALAKKLRPMLAKAFASSMPEPLKLAPVEPVAAPPTPESQKKVATPPRL
jgi:hypothetical protein